MHFSAHGDGRVYWQDNNLYVEPKGLFNLEGTLVLNQQIESAIKLKPVDFWCRFEIFTHFDTLGPMEGIPGLIDNLIYSKNNGCILLCLCCESMLMREMIKSSCKTAGLEVIEFSSMKDAQMACSTELRSKLE